MANKEFDIRTLTDGHNALRNFLAQVPATALPTDMMIKLARIERQLRPVADIMAMRRQALASEFNLEISPDQQRYIPAPGPEGQVAFARYTELVQEMMAAPYPLDIDPIPWEEAAQAMKGLTVGHYMMMPFAFSVE